MGRYLLLAKKLAAMEGIAERGYRLVLNNGPDGGQIVPHLHMHLLGGCKLQG
jgi:histidine triad (HIT) family protein